MYIPQTIRRFVAERAEHRCEYCRIYEIDSYFSFHIDHIISLKHGSATLKIFDLNHPESVIERREMIRFGIF